MEECDLCTEDADVYTEAGVSDLVEDDLLSPDEEGFMLGYLEA